MTIPSKKRRTITVEGTKYAYAVSGHVNVYIKNLRTGKEFEWIDESRCGLNRWQITPRFVRKLIEDNGV